MPARLARGAGADAIKAQPAGTFKASGTGQGSIWHLALARLARRGAAGGARDWARQPGRVASFLAGLLPGRQLRHDQQLLWRGADAGHAPLRPADEEHGIPVAPLILGLVLGEMLEQTFVQSMIKADGDWLGFLSRPIAGVPGVATLAIWVVTLGCGAQRLWRHPGAGGGGHLAAALKAR